MKKDVLLYTGGEDFAEIINGGGYYVDKNMIVVLQDGMRHALEYHTKADEELSLDAIKGDYTKKVQQIF